MAEAVILSKWRFIGWSEKYIRVSGKRRKKKTEALVTSIKIEKLFQSDNDQMFFEFASKWKLSQTEYQSRNKRSTSIAADSQF